MKRILVLEPYYGGSHKLFLQGLQNCVAADYTVLTLPARKWKMRMQLSALWFVDQIRQMPAGARSFDTVLCSTFIDVAVLRTLLSSVSGWNGGTRFCTYFHENQFVYPVQQGKKELHQFTSINFTTALASDRCAFNSRYNLETFLAGVQGYLKKASDMKFPHTVRELREKSCVLYPGMDYRFIDRTVAMEKEKGVPVIVWNHRWEHDKGPEVFFDALYTLQKLGVAFRLIVLGQSFANMPHSFVEAEKRLQKELVHFGFADSPEQYGALLKQGDILVSCARHEFFGISVLEGIRAGCRPLLPDDLSYPELYGQEFLYSPGTLALCLERLIRNPVPLTHAESVALTERFSWQICSGKYKDWL